MTELPHLAGATAAFELIHEPPPVAVEPTPDLLEATVRRMVELLASRTRFVNAPIYRMVRVPGTSAAHGPLGGFAVDTFARYALVWDLLEAEAAEVALGLRDRMPLRAQLLPSTASALEPSARVCAGGVQGLCAFARPAGADGKPDYLILVQERSPLVVNATGRLAAIPKCFHQPTTDERAEVAVGTSLLRELEEELFGREELDASWSGGAAADPMHPSRLSEPMRWLQTNAGWDMPLTGFGFNLTTGNYEFSALIAIHDEAFWGRYGGLIQANWEAARLRALSSQDREGLAALLSAPGWSDEGLVTFALGLRHLAELSPERVALPPMEIGVAS
ncbi:hypothetical protein [Intrasporangium mesophilum]